MSTFLPELTRSFLNPVFLMFGNPNSVFIKIRKIQTWHLRIIDFVQFWKELNRN